MLHRSKWKNNKVYLLNTSKTHTRIKPSPSMLHANHFRSITFISVSSPRFSSASSTASFILRAGRTTLMWIMIFTIIHQGSKGLVESTEPIIQTVPNSFIFQSIGELYPVTNFVHMRVSLQLDELQRLEQEVCEEANKLKLIFREYSSGQVINSESFNLSSKMSQDMLNDDLKKVSFERFSAEHLKKKIGAAFSVYFATVLDMLRKGCDQSIRASSIIVHSRSDRASTASYRFFNSNGNKTDVKLGSRCKITGQPTSRAAD